MKKTIFLFASLVLAVSITSCKSDASEVVEDAPKEKVCSYSYDDSTTDFEWTAYKTSDKAGVPGSFNEIEVTFAESDDPKKVIESIEFSMNTASVETNNEERNGKIAKHFFETIDTETIDGSIKSLGDNGKATIEIEMNGIAVEIEGDYALNGSAFKFESIIDVSAWNALSGIEALNTICKDLHTGADGVSKLWSEVKLTLQTKLNKSCE